MRIKLDELCLLISEAVRKAYDILGVSTSASPEEIKSAFRKKAIQLHPDRNQGKDTSSEMVKLNVAYGLLSDPTKKYRYDAIGDKTLGDDGPGFSPSQRSASDSAQANQWNWQRPQKPAQNQTPPKTKSASKRYFTRKKRIMLRSGEKRSILNFRECELVGRTVIITTGTVGSPGQGDTRKRTYHSVVDARVFFDIYCDTALRQGFEERIPTAQQGKPSQAPSAKTEPSATAGSSNSVPNKGKKDTYKIYGRKGKPPVTRYKGKIYNGPEGSKFRAGDVANVDLEKDGKLKVHDKKTGHSQSWTSESLDDHVERVLNELLKFVDD